MVKAVVRVTVSETVTRTAAPARPSWQNQTGKILGFGNLTRSNHILWQTTSHDKKHIR